METSLEVQSTLQSLLRAQTAAVILGILITAFGFVALITHVLRAKRGSRELLWFGLSATLYGVRELIKSPLTWLLFDLSRATCFAAERTIGNFILIPIILLIEEIYGKGWRSSVRWLLWFFGAYGVVATGIDVVTGQPGTATDAGAIFLVVFAILLIANYLLGYRPPPNRHARALLFGAIVFSLTFINEHLVLLNAVPWRLQIEAVGFFILICSLGYVALRRNLDNEQNLLALEEEMRSAKRIQTSTLPDGAPEMKDADICVRYLPMTAVAGDFYDFIQLDADRIGIAIADVAGHGVPAALVASMVKVAIGSQESLATNPPALMAGLNTVMCRQARGKLITGGYLFLDFAQRQATYSAAAHPPLLLRRRSDKTTVEYKENGLILGVRPGETYDAMTFDLRPGDRILLYTDGIVEAANSTDQLFGEERFQEAIAEGDHLDAAHFATHVLDSIQIWCGPAFAQADDVTLVVIDCR